MPDAHLTLERLISEYAFADGYVGLLKEITRRGPKRKGITYRCAVCGRLKYARHYFANRGAKFCSRTCMAASSSWRESVGRRPEAGAAIRKVQDTFVTQAQAVQKYGINPVTLYRWWHKGRIQVYSIGRERLYEKKELEAILHA